MKKMMMAMTVAVAAATVFGATKRKVQAMSGNDDGPETTGRAAKILVDQIQLGQNALAQAPCIGGLQQFYKKPRQWIVLNTKYTTFGSDKSKFLDQLTFNWHVVLDTKTATENKGNKESLPPWSYFTTTVTYFNIPAGQHGASVCLPPAYREHYGEAKAVGLEIYVLDAGIGGGGIDGIDCGTDSNGLEGLPGDGGDGVHLEALFGYLYGRHVYAEDAGLGNDRLSG